MKNFKFLLTVILMPLAFNAYADGTDVVCGPWLQNVTQNEFTVMWMTGGKCLSWLETAPDDGSAFEACERPRTYRTIAGKRYTGTLHAVRVKGLEPGHSYRYRIYAREVLDDSNAYCSIYGKELNTGVSGTVRTLDYGAGQCTFSMINDIHDRADLYRKLTDPLADKDIDFLLLNGDIISYAANIDTAACHTFGPAADMIRNLPLFFARGNHEGRGADACLMPGLFRTSTGEFYYIFRQGPVAFIVLDAGEDKPDTSVEYSGLADYDSYRQEELEWLKEAVKDPLFAEAPVKVAICHIPSLRFPDSWHSQIWANEYFNPVLNAAGIDLMLSGHHHRHIYVEAGECGNSFPIIANDNEARLDFTATSGQIHVSTYDTSDSCTHTYTIPVKR